MMMKTVTLTIMMILFLFVLFLGGIFSCFYLASSLPFVCPRRKIVDSKLAFQLPSFQCAHVMLEGKCAHVRVHLFVRVGAVGFVLFCSFMV